MVNKNSKYVALILLLSISANSMCIISWDAGVRRIKTGVSSVKNGASNAWSFVAAKFKKKEVEKQEENGANNEQIEIEEKKPAATKKRLVARMWAKVKTISSKIKLGSRIKNGWAKVRPFSRLKNGCSKVAGFLGYIFGRKISLKRHRIIIQDLMEENKQLQKNCESYHFLAELNKKQKDALKEKLSG